MGEVIEKTGSRAGAFVAATVGVLKGHHRAALATAEGRELAEARPQGRPSATKAAAPRFYQGPELSLYVGAGRLLCAPLHLLMYTRRGGEDSLPSE